LTITVAHASSRKSSSAAAAAAAAAAAKGRPASPCRALPPLLMMNSEEIQIDTESVDCIIGFIASGI
jgi:hypothetical protein